MRSGYQLSYWEIQNFFQHRNVLIVGAGITGLSTALAIRRAKPNWSILVVDRHPVALGASTRNAGFACFGSPSELVADLENSELGDVVDLVRMRWEGLQLLRKTIGDSELRYEPLGGYELFMPGDTERFDKCYNMLQQLNAELSFTGSPAFSVADRQVLDGMGLRGFSRIINCHHEGAIDPGSMIRRFHHICHRERIDIICGIEVEKIECDQSRASLKLIDGYELHADTLVLATNGFTRSLAPQAKVTPARNQVIVTSEVPGLKLKGTFHYNEGFTYFRNIGNRVLIGGARNLDTQGEETDQFGLTEKIMKHLETMLHTNILVGQEATIEHRWSGILGIGSEKKPIVDWHKDRILLACRMGGMGISIGALIGEMAAQKILST